MAQDKKLVSSLSLLGFGNMGQAIVKGLLNKGVFECLQVKIYDPAEDKQREAQNLGVQVAVSPKDLLQDAGILLIAVKPQMIQTALEPLSAVIHKRHLVISIVAGVSIRYIKELLKCADLRVVRTMPNTPALVGEGITAISFSEECDEQDQSVAQQIFQAVGKTVLVPEEQIDAVTAISGSGPAYFFYLCECMIDAGKLLGLSEETVLSLVSQTFYGSASLLIKGNELPGVLRARVTSKGGTTESALRTMEENNFKSTMINAIKSAYHRAKELGK